MKLSQIEMQKDSGLLDLRGLEGSRSSFLHVEIRSDALKALISIPNFADKRFGESTY